MEIISGHRKNEVILYSHRSQNPPQTVSIMKTNYKLPLTVILLFSVVAGFSQTWQSLGPNQVYFANQQRDIQANVNCIAQSVSSPSILFAGTEPGEVFKSTDGGSTWNSSSMNTDFKYGGVHAIAISPANASVIYCGTYKIYKSTDGGATWNICFNASNFGVNEILVNPSNSSIVLAACDSGLFRSTNAGSTWTQLYTDRCFDVKFNSSTAATVYLVKDNPALLKCEFFISTDAGATWTVQTNGWYNSIDPNRTDMGARIGVSAADPNRVYAYLIGASKINDNGFIGLYRSDDGGVTWSLPNGPDGNPYSNAHPNLASSFPTYGNNGGFNNCAIMVSNTNADDILIGGIYCWSSSDGGFNFAHTGTLIADHPGMQDFRATANGYWVTTEGGIHLSNDFFAGNNLIRDVGLRATEFWGFANGWNDDVIVAGTNHEGNLAYTSAYGAGNFLSLNGPQNPTDVATGYLNPQMNSEIYTSDLGQTVLPSTISGPVNFNIFALSPNESNTPASSSEIQFLPSCYNTAFLCLSNAIWISKDRCATFSVLHSFGINANALAEYIEISRSNEKVMYVTQQPATGNQGFLWKTTDGGVTWNSLTIPTGNSSRMLITLSPTDANTLWLAYPSGANGNKIFKTTDGGVTWNNLTTSVLDNQEVHSILNIGGTNGGIYYCTDKTVFYKNNTLGNWVPYNSGLPQTFNSDICKPFYKNGKIRIASYGKGIWENDLYEQPAKPVAQIMVDKDTMNVACAADSFHFDDYSMLNQTNATRQWTFQGGSPATSTIRNPTVTFPTNGTFLVTLKVTDANNMTDTDSMYVVVNATTVPATMSEGFQQATFPPPNWIVYDQMGDGTWTLSTTVGGYSQSTQSAIFDNYNLNSGGSFDDMRFRVDLSNAATTKMFFDVAYARYNNTYLDTMQVLVSTDCGATFAMLYQKSSTILATAPDTGGFFVPSSAEWRTDTIDLNSYVGQSNLLVVFRNIGRFGNCLYIDNINISSDGVFVPEIAQQKNEVNVFPNPVASGSTIYVVSGQTDNFNFTLYDSNGKVVLNDKVNSGEEIKLPEDLSTGNYFYTIVGRTVMKKGKMIVLKGKN